MASSKFYKSILLWFTQKVAHVDLDMYKNMYVSAMNDLKPVMKVE